MYTFDSWYQVIKENVIPVVDLAKSCYKQGIIIDIGSNLGSFTDSLMEIYPESEYHLFEPSPKFSEYLIDKYKNNPNVFLNLKGLGEENTTTKILFNPDNWGHNIITSHQGDDIEIIRLDSYIGENNLKNVGLIKIDVEFYEPFVLNGLKKYIENTSNLPPIILEHNWGGSPYKDKWYQITKWLFKYYKPFEFDKDVPMFDLILLPNENTIRN
jgi:FkbM family methyltransferase